MNRELAADIRRISKFACRKTMDGLVQDLAQALEESSSSSYYPKARRRALKRRAKLLGLAQRGTKSDDSESSAHKEMLHDRPIEGRYQSDSEDMSSIRMDIATSSKPGKRIPSMLYAANMINLESDSLNDVNENYRPHTRRKRKCKRMAVDGDVSNIPSSRRSTLKQKKRKFLQQLPFNDNRSAWCFVSGKRKRGLRDRGGPGDYETGESSSGTSPHTGLLSLKHLSLSSDTALHQRGMNSSSGLSSSESDTGIFTNDEGREGDDEQSDWCHSPGPAPDLSDFKMLLESDSEDQEDDADSQFKAILSGSFQYLSDQSKQQFLNKLRMVQKGVSERTLRAGRRRLRESRPGYQIVTPHNEEISKFLQDPEQQVLKLNCTATERDQLRHVAAMYSLSLQETPETALIKTNKTTQAVMMCPPVTPRLQVFLADGKRRRQTPPCGPSDQPPLPESNIGHGMLVRMGWEPGTGLGSESTGITSPVLPYQTATGAGKYPGLGHS